MEHLVESHLGGYYISSADPEIITAYCESCGDSDWIILSWEEGLMMETLLQYFSEVYYTPEYIEDSKEAGITKQEMIEEVVYKYDFEYKNIIDNLFEDNNISEKEYRELLEVNLETQKKQINMVRNAYSKKTNTKKKTLTN